MMRKLVISAVIVGTMLSATPASATPHSSYVEVCTWSGRFVQGLETSRPVNFLAPATGGDSTPAYLVVEVPSRATTCSDVTTDLSGGTIPTGVLIEAETTGKPVLH